MKFISLYDFVVNFVMDIVASVSILADKQYYQSTEITAERKLVKPVTLKLGGCCGKV